MIPIYQAANSTDAHLIKNLLAQAGIDSYIRGEYLQGGLGEIPVSGQVSVCVSAEDVLSAREIILQWDQAKPGKMEDEDTSVVVYKTPSGHSTVRVILAVLIGAAIGATATLAASRVPTNEHGIDYNDDGRVDERIILSGNAPIRIETDRNKDGKVDMIQRFNTKGMIFRGESDEDFDGDLETSYRYLHGQWLSTEVDEDADGLVEYTADAIAGVVYSEEWKDATGKTSKKVLYRNGWPFTADIDTDLDGQLDTRHHYDKRVEIERSEPLPASER